VSWLHLATMSGIVLLLTAGSVGKGQCRAEGMIKNFNTVEEFKKADKTAMLHQAARSVSQLSLPYVCTFYHLACVLHPSQASLPPFWPFPSRIVCPP
jgi:hypothetical protein